MGSYHTDHRHIGLPMASAAVVALAVSLAVFATAQQHASALGVPSFWPWLLTSLQVVALWSAGRRLWWGWLLGGFVQVPWIAYALVTDQIGFIPGCVISAAVQIYSFLRSSSHQRSVEVST